MITASTLVNIKLNPKNNMEKNQHSEELQSRRDFFKEAARKALPVIGAIALAGSPIAAQAMVTTPMGCENNCSGSCKGRCEGLCAENGCKGNCSGTCSGGCKSSNE